MTEIPENTTAPQYRFADELPRPVAFVLAGGASFGSIQVGQLRALADSDITPDFVVGTSVGSLNGAVVAQDPAAAPERLTELWTTATREEVFGGMLSTAVKVATGSPAAVPNDGLRGLIERAVSAKDFADLQIPHTAMATDFDTGHAVPISEGELVTALLASAAIPAVFPPIVRDGVRLVDGGLVANVPISQAVGQGARTIVVLDCGFTVLAPDDENSLSGRIMRTLAIMAAQQVRRDMEGTEGLTVLHLPGPWPADTRPDNFSKSAELADKAEELSREWLVGLEVDGPGVYGTSPADILSERKAVLSDAARDLAEEAGALPVDDENRPITAATEEVVESSADSMVAAQIAADAADKAASAAQNAKEAATAAAQDPAVAEKLDAAEKSAVDAAGAAASASQRAKAAADSALGAGRNIIAKVRGDSDEVRGDNAEED